MDTTAVQRALLSLGYDPGPVDGLPGRKTTAAVVAFQRAAGLKPDGVVGPLTTAALAKAALAKGGPVQVVPGSNDPGSGGGGGLRIVPLDWMPAAQMSRLIVHWTAGNHTASGLDRSHYHILVESDGKLVRGIPSIALNDARGAKTGYAAHTLNCNTGSIGVSLCCMAGAVEKPFKPGSAPMTKVQWDAVPAVVADLCRRYGIPVTPKTVLSHAEVQANLGIKQKGKWDIARLAFDPSIVGAAACGDLLRRQVQAVL
ncbi:peptidoglycan-binding protein [Bosea sp. BK604]|uniref:peptidoglycan recognition protein family protein n=1 Tax=Bosea sp. BK604 TaxID=2512180 RepID=UPI001047FB5E|nr:peptidoglycan-binding protein [Bosea sp. BK604]TCR60927.1 N-acetylmuramoyl-L-alanine amidase [Bosea sp. BK604]